MKPGLFLLSVFLCSAAFAADQGAIPTRTATQTAPGITWEKDGTTHALADYKGQPVVVHFWATWCAPCIEELPKLARVAKRMKAGGIIFVTPSLDIEPGLVEKFYARHDIASLPVIMDSQSKAFAAAGLTGLPGTLFINAEGKLVGKIDGPVHWDNADTEEFLSSLAKR